MKKVLGQKAGKSSTSTTSTTHPASPPTAPVARPAPIARPTPAVRPARPTLAPAALAQTAPAVLSTRSPSPPADSRLPEPVPSRARRTAAVPQPSQQLNKDDFGGSLSDDPADELNGDDDDMYEPVAIVSAPSDAYSTHPTNRKKVAINFDDEEGEGGATYQGKPSVTIRADDEDSDQGAEDDDDNDEDDDDDDEDVVETSSRKRSRSDSKQPKKKQRLTNAQFGPATAAFLAEATALCRALAVSENPFADAPTRLLMGGEAIHLYSQESAYVPEDFSTNPEYAELVCGL